MYGSSSRGKGWTDLSQILHTDPPWPRNGYWIIKYMYFSESPRKQKMLLFLHSGYTRQDKTRPIIKRIQ